MCISETKNHLFEFSTHSLPDIISFYSGEVLFPTCKEPRRFQIEVLSPFSLFLPSCQLACHPIRAHQFCFVTSVEKCD